MASEQGLNSLTLETRKRILIAVYEWATHLAFEEEAQALPYIVPRPEWQTLFKRLRFSHGNLIKVVGPQGAGKTCFAFWLFKSLENAGDDTAFVKMKKGQEPLGYFDTYKAVEEIEMGVGEPKNIIVTERDWKWFYTKVKNLIVDLWDYSKTNVRDIIKALDAIQDWWLMRSENRVKKTGTGAFIDTGVPNIVVMLQKEALPLHFFLGKMTFFELKPWKPEELVAAYEGFAQRFTKNKDEATFPFTRDALMEVAFLSRGIFRKFKEYVAACLDTLLTDDAGFDINKTIALDDVKSIITTDKLVQDMELTLCELWPRNKENRVFAVKVLRLLREHGPTAQKTIAAEIFDNNLMLCSRILNKLGDYGFLKVEKKGAEKIWSV